MNENDYREEEVEISIMELFKAIYRKKFMIILLTILSVALAFIYLEVTIPIYETSATVMISPIENSTDMTSLLTGGISSGSEIETEIEILKSTKTLQKALDSLDLTQYLNSEGLRYSDFDPVITPDSVSKSITVVPVKSTNIVKITIQNQNPEFAKDLTNALVMSHDEVLANITKDSVQASINFINEQIPINQANLDLATDAYADYQRENDILQSSIENEFSLVTYQYIKNRIAPLKLELEESEKVLKNLDLDLSHCIITNSAAAREVSDGIYSLMNEMFQYDLLVLLSNKQGDLALTQTQAQRYFTLSSNLAEKEKELTNIISTMLDVDVVTEHNFSKAMCQKITSLIEISLLEEKLEEVNVIIETFPETEKELARLQSDIQVYQTMAVTLLKMQQETELTSAATIKNVTAIDFAQIPEKPVKPNKLMTVAIAGMLAVIVGCAIAIAISMLDKRLYIIEDVKKIFKDNVSFLGWVPVLRLNKRKQYKGSIVYAAPASFSSERYKLIASNLIFGKKRTNRTIAVCSSGIGEGKTSVMCNTATALAQNGYKVLLVDGDLRMPFVEEFFELEKRERLGLVDIVVDDANVEECILSPYEDMQNLNILPCGTIPPIPSVIFSNDNFKKLVADLKNEYDIILFDAPPLIFASELLILAKITNEVLIVTRAGITNTMALNDLYETFKANEVEVSGVCLNAYIPSRNTSYSSYGNYSYSKHQNDEDVVMKVAKFKTLRNTYKKIYSKNSKLRDNRIRKNNVK